MRGMAWHAARGGLVTVLGWSAGAQQVRDSAGVRIVRYGEDAVPPARWTVHATPVLAIGGAEGSGPAELAGVRGVIRFADGALAIANATTRDVRVFDASGRHVRTIGRRGQGPGEFETIRQIQRSGDTLVVIEGFGRLQMFTRDGTLVRSTGRPVFPRRTAPMWYGSLRDGSLLMVGLDPPDSTSEMVATLTLGVARAGSSEVEPLDAVQAFEVVKKEGAVGIPGARGYSPVYLGAVPQIVVAGGRLCHSTSGRWEVACHGADHRHAWRTLREVERAPVTAADRDAFREGYLRANVNVPRARTEAVAASFEFARRRPSFGRLVAASNGDLWVGEFLLSDALILGREGTPTPPRPSTWSVLDASGRWIADVRLPAGFALLEAGPDYVAGVERDADDVERVVVYRVTR